MKCRLISLVVCALCLVNVRMLEAGGPFVVDSVGLTGTALIWQDRKLTWSYDAGPLSASVGNTTALSWVREAMDLWANAKLPDPDDISALIMTTDVAHHEAGSVGEDITAANLAFYLSDASGTAGLIVFDADGTIMEALGFDPQSTLGLSQPLAVDESGLNITRGIVILNGKILSYLATKGDAEQLFKAALLHEVGHLYNLDHTQINLDISRDDACTLGGSCPGSPYIATMFPELKTHRQGSLNYDDRITLSWIYPNAAFRSKYCVITGEIRDRNGKPLQGVNVIARRATGTETPRVDVRSMVSGVLYPACVADSRYFLHGIIPGESYVVMYEPLAEEYTGASGFEPLENPPAGFAPAVVTIGGKATAVTCAAGGEIIAMDTMQIDVANPCASLTPVPGDDSDASSDDAFGTSPSSGKSSCGLADQPLPRSNAAAPFIIIFSGCVLLVVLRRLRGVQCRF